MTIKNCYIFFLLLHTNVLICQTEDFRVLTSDSDYEAGLLPILVSK